MRKGKINREDLINVVADWRIKEKISNYKLVKMVMEQFDYKQSYAYEIVREARLKIADVYRETHADALNEAIAELEEQRESAKKLNNSKLVLEITKELNKIQGLYIEKVNHSGTLNGDFNIKLIFENENILNVNDN